MPLFELNQSQGQVSIFCQQNYLRVYLIKEGYRGLLTMAIPTNQAYHLRYFYSAIVERSFQQPSSGPSQSAESEF